MASPLKAYSIPVLFLFLAIAFQLFITPSKFPPSHYDVLGIKRYSSIEEVDEAYEKISSKWNLGVEIPLVNDFVKVRYAFELLTNPLWKRDYDVFGVDEYLHLMEKVKGQYAGETFSKVDLPLLDTSSSDIAENAFNVLTTEGFKSTIGSTGARLIQVYSSGSNRSAQFLKDWKIIGIVLDGVASASMVELGEAQLATYLAERKSTGQPFFRNGLPSLIAFPPGCQSSDCLVRYQGDLTVDAVTDWFATSILGLPRILFYAKETLGQYFIAKSGQHKVKVIIFSRNGERAAPFLRQAAKNYWAYASFGYVFWREEESAFWWNTFEVESAPAVVIIKDPGVKPVVFHGNFDSSSFANVMELNKHQDLPQLRSLTSLELGCDARGYSRAGNDTQTWYCMVLAGRPSLELNKMRETILKVQAIVSKDGESSSPDNAEVSPPLEAAAALKEKRLTFTWLDGEVQKKYCFFYINSESSYETCGPRRDIVDVPELFIVRYKRNSTKAETKIERRPKTIWDSFQEDVDDDLASQLVARYNGSVDIPQIIQWVSQIIKDGDSRDLPFFRTNSPELIPEDGDAIWSRGAQSVLSTSNGMKYKIHKIITNVYDSIGDPRLGPFLLLAALVSFGSMWMQRNRSTQTSQSSQPRTKEKPGPKRRARTKETSRKDRPPSMTDDEPKDATQLLPSESDSD